jgi:hypothetical protein
MLQTFVPIVSFIFFRRMLQACLSGYIAYVSRICLQVFYLDVVYVFAMVSSVFQLFLQAYHMYVSSVSFALKRMLQVLHLNILKVDQVLHLPPRLLLPRLGVSSSFQLWLGIRRLLPLFSMLVTFMMAWVHVDA